MRREGKNIKEPYADTPFLINPGSVGCSLFMSPESGAVPIVNVVGEIDISNAPQIYSLMWQTSSRGSKSLILNMEQLEFMDSSGLQVLLRLRERLRSKKQKVFIVGPRPQIQKLLKLTGFDKLFPLYKTNGEVTVLLQNPAVFNGPETGEAKSSF